mgnify:CR=1 FL=1
MRDNTVNQEKSDSIKKINCPICNKEAIFIFISKHDKRIYECENENCKHFFTPPYMENQGIVPRDGNIENLSDKAINIFGERNERLLKLFMKWIQNKNYPITFLDYGAGNAHVSRTFKQSLGTKVKIYCLEANPAFQNLYKKYGLIQITTPNELSDKIDFIYMIEVIEHVEDPIATMKQLIKYLNKDGLIFLSTPLGTRIENKTNAYNTPSHLHFFSKKSFNLMLKKSGFMEITFQYYPEMYPIPSNKYLKLKKTIKKLISHLLLNPKMPITHLVGFTKPINIKTKLLN